jgi:hypothetical protein
MRSASQPIAEKRADGAEINNCALSGPERRHRQRGLAALDYGNFRVWRWSGYYYALPRLATPLLRSKSGVAPFERASGSPFDNDPAFKNIRHVAVLTEGSKQSRIQRSGQPKTDSVAPEVGGVPIAVGRAEVPRFNDDSTFTAQSGYSLTLAA